MEVRTLLLSVFTLISPTFPRAGPPTAALWPGSGEPCPLTPHSSPDLGELLQVECSVGPGWKASLLLVRKTREMSTVLGLTLSLLGISLFPALGTSGK